jgi:hypothetical protein
VLEKIVAQGVKAGGLKTQDGNSVVLMDAALRL